MANATNTVNFGIDFSNKLELKFTEMCIEDSDLVEKAKVFIEHLYKDNLRRDGITKALRHPAGVVHLLNDITITNSDILAAAWLHDVIEDYGVTKDFIAREFNENIARIVSLLTRDVNREEYIQRIMNADYSVQIIKLADTVHNCSCLPEGIKKGTIPRKINDCDMGLFQLARKICPKYYKLLHIYLDPFIK